EVRLRDHSAAGVGSGAGVEPSVGSVGDSYDNALAETINGLYKAEIIHRRGPWRSLEAVEFATLEWVDWFNNRRLLEPIGNIPPAEAEERYYAMLEQPAMAACLKPNGLRPTRGGSFRPRRHVDSARGSGLEEEGFERSTDRVLVEVDPRYFRPTEVDSLLGDASKARAKLSWR